MSRFICVDFDGTLVDHMYPQIGQEVPQAFYWLNKIQENNNIILWTVRSGVELAEAVAYVTGKGIELYAINDNPEQRSFSSSPKAWGHLYIDDAAFNCPLQMLPDFMRPCVDWSVVGPAVMDILKN